MGVRTQWRAWMVRAAVVTVASTASLFGLAAPAFAADPDITITGLGNANLGPGESTNLTFTVENPDDGDTPSINIRVESTAAGVTLRRNGAACGQGGRVCAFIDTIATGASKNYTIQVTASGVPPGQESNGELQIRANNASESTSISGRGPDQAATVPEVSGIVTDTATGKGISAAKVFLQDSANASYEVGTGKDGKFTFTSKPDAPIAPGTIALRVEKDGFALSERTIQGQPGVPVRNVKLSMASNVTASATATAAAPSGSETAGPTLDGVPGDATVGNEEEAGLSWLLIAIGGLLVLLGIGAIVLLLVRRRGDDDDDDEPAPRRGPPPGRGGPPRGAPQPPRRGAPPERTTVMRGGPGPMGPPVSPGPRGADQTMIARSPLADMPTQMHRPLPVDTDPYGARQNGAHAGPQYPGGPGPAGGYGPPPYGGPPPAGYPGGGPAYGHPEPQYGHPDPQYGQPYPGGGPAYPGAAGGYDQPTYGQPYGQQGGAQPYDPQSGYDPYDPRGQRPPPPPPSGQGGDGRRVDWLDD